jgi:hypothetical protein
VKGWTSASLRAPESAPPAKAPHAEGKGGSPLAGSQAAPRARKATGANTTSNTDAPEWWEAERPEVNATHVAVQSEDAAVRLRLREIFAASVRQAEAEGMPVACLLHPLAR